MWKLLFEYEDGSACTISGKHKMIPPDLMEKYYHRYGYNAARATYQKYPKKDNQPVDMHKQMEKIQALFEAAV